MEDITQLPRPDGPPNFHKRHHNHHIRFKHGIAIPTDMTSPRQEGYRTPTIEDYERHEKRRDQLEDHPSQLHLQLPSGVLSLFSETRSHLSLTKSLEKLLWKERLRHYTWTFFTMTMATGGIANVIHAGKYTERQTGRSS